MRADGCLIVEREAEEAGEAEKSEETGEAGEAGKRENLYITANYYIMNKKCNFFVEKPLTLLI